MGIHASLFMRIVHYVRAGISVWFAEEFMIDGADGSDCTFFVVYRLGREIDLDEGIPE